MTDRERKSCEPALRGGRLYNERGPWRFRLVRLEDETGVSGTGHVADGVMFQRHDDHPAHCVLRWRTATTSVAVYETHAALMAIHGHSGKTVCEWTDEPPPPAFFRGRDCCVQDAMENAPFSSVGGLERRAAPIVPPFVQDADREAWLAGYVFAARSMYGDDWRTVVFAWSPALSIGGEAG